MGAASEMKEMSAGSWRERLRWDWRQGLSPRWITFLRIAAFITAFLSSVTAFSMFAFLTYLNALKETFFLTQTQVEVIMAMDWLGMGVTWPVGAFIERYGIRAGSVLALILSGGANLLIWSANDSTYFYNENYGLLAFYFLVAGCGCGTTYLTAMSATIPNFAPQHRGAVVGIISSGCALGPLIFISLYFSFFTTGSYDDPASEDIQGYFLMVSLCFIIVNLLGSLLYGNYPPSHAKEERSPLLTRDPEKPIQVKTFDAPDDGGASDRPKWMVGDCDRKEVTHEGEIGAEVNIDDAPPLTFWQLITDPVFHFIGWPAIIIMALVPMDANNVSTYLVSFRMLEYTTALTYLGPAVALVFSVCIGFVSDLAAKYAFRGIIALINSIVLLLVYFLSAFLLGELGVLVINISLVNASFPAAYCVTPVLLTEEYGVASFARAWGLVHFGYAVGGFIAQALMGMVYDVYIMDDNVCYGQLCFQYTFIGATLAVLVAVLLTLLYIKYSKAVRRARHRGLEPDETDILQSVGDSSGSAKK